MSKLKSRIITKIQDFRTLCVPSYKGRSTLEQKVPKITVRWRLKYRNSHKCKQIAEICKQTVEICKQTAVKNVNKQLSKCK